MNQSKDLDVTMTMTQKAYEDETDRQGRLIPKGIIQFVEGGEIALWRDDTLAWSVTGSGRAWGNPGEMLRAYGDYKVIRHPDDEAGAA